MFRCGDWIGRAQLGMNNKKYKNTNLPDAMVPPVTGFGPPIRTVKAQPVSSDNAFKIAKSVGEISFMVLSRTPQSETTTLI